MTRFAVMSDLHFEWHQDGGRSFVGSLSGDADAILLAGDIATLSGLALAVQLFCERYPQVVMVAGNHEQYGKSPRGKTHELLARLDAKHSNFTWLENKTTTVAGKRIVGTTLWFEKVRGAPTWSLNDFDQIVDFEQWVYDDNRKAQDFLEANVQADDIVMTHYLPSQRCVHPRYAGSPLNVFFVCDMERTIKRAQPVLWVNGHTHSSVDCQLGRTHLLCNPFGYLGHETNPAFKDDLVIEV